MKIIVDDAAYNYLTNEMELKEGDAVRFFVRYGGFSSIQKGFSLGLEKDAPKHEGSHQLFHGVDFYVEEDEEWYFDQHNLHVIYEPQQEGIAYKYEMTA